MSEEEIIKDLQKYVELIDKEYCDECNELNVISGKYCNGSRNVALAIQGLLNLYNKEKEKNKELRKPKYIIDLKTNKITKLTNDFVSKDKIKEILDKYKFCKVEKLKECYKDILELLEERN